MWLGGCALLVFVMVVLGGVTRLTHSGLSMVEWQPLMGVIPPLTEADWLEVFGKYKSSPEYQQVNFGMSLSEFKSIFYFEYAHRVLGRVIGLAFLVPKTHIKTTWSVFGFRFYSRRATRLARMVYGSKWFSG